MSLLIQPTPVPITDPKFTNDLAVEEALDALDPLRHFRLEDDGQRLDLRDDYVLPIQPQLAVKQIMNLSFSGDISGAHREQLTIKLAVDASPGCGGVTWPAGQVDLPWLIHGEIGFLLICTFRFSPNIWSN